ncbi:S-adenosylmethionine mitochondrial carrier protein isoform X1 [Corvus cornix cornix]|uniref:S-adenosylmethionine mitochondrial carrier protein isoform X1 n=1 Tax=Corvus brachyrhynchos TaxID=85066 RepID=UPI0008163550|nr:PREDICTED: S-adenosylmethionine mitochondrial carrier protein isoform X1 [Corvus brachyrhynchos]XP_019135870.1 S-adenosylmethionine mitochondrial carrier protein isoform X1 [Corvus cornix cornix]
MEPRESWAALAAGGVAGVCVDLILFPLDTVKTRLQSPQGFRKAGGFRGIYAGVPSTAIGSFPNAAAFFITYENVKSVLPHGSSSYLSPATHMVAASLGEVVACLIRVPSEVIKQRAQVSPSSSTLRILSHTLYHEGIQGLYRGYKSTVLREYLVGGLLLCHQSSVLTDSFLSGTVSPLGVLKGSLVMEAGSRGGFLAVSSLWSFCRWICSCSHHTSRRSKDENYVGKACSQVLSHGWQPSAWEASSSWGHMRRLGSCCSEPARPLLRGEKPEKPPRQRRSRAGSRAFLRHPSQQLSCRLRATLPAREN